MATVRHMGIRPGVREPGTIINEMRVGIADPHFFCDDIPRCRGGIAFSFPFAGGGEGISRLLKFTDFFS